LLNLEALGAQVFLATIIGQDKYGEIFVNSLNETGCFRNTTGLLKLATRKTTCKTRFIAQDQHVLRVDEEDTQDISRIEEDQLFECIQKICTEQKIDVAIFEDYNKGILTDTLIKRLLKFFCEKNILTTVDPKKKNFFTYQQVDIFKPNLKELQESLGKNYKLKDLTTFLGLIEELEQKIKLKMTLLTLSENGVLMKDQESYCHIPAHPRKIVDVSGAGDTVIAVASLCLVIGFPMCKIAAWANLAGGLVCEKIGVVTINLEEFIQELKKSGLLN
jgi:rfaE bifunctional protein kinase chain/domain